MLCIEILLSNEEESYIRSINPYILVYIYRERDLVNFDKTATCKVRRVRDIHNLRKLLISPRRCFAEGTLCNLFPFSPFK